MNDENKPETNVYELEVSVRTVLALQDFGITDIREMSNYTRSSFAAMRQVGIKTLYEVENVMDEYHVNWFPEAKRHRNSMMTMIHNFCPNYMENYVRRMLKFTPKHGVFGPSDFDMKSHLIPASDDLIDQIYRHLSIVVPDFHSIIKIE